MAGRYSWEELLPAEEARAAVQFMVEVWDKVSTAYPERFKYGMREPSLTLMLVYHLQRLRADGRLLGFWNAETQVPKMNGPGSLSVTRKDISYQSNFSGTRLDLTFEFKKVTTSNLSKYRGDDGMKRFVDGDYAIREPLAFMVAITRQGDGEPLKKLRQSLMAKPAHKLLRMVHDDGNRYLIEPSEAAPGDCVFDTRHKRPREKAPAKGAITLGHIFLGCPS